MLLGGLWHGAAYTFIVWGGIHGVCLAVERAARPAPRRRAAPPTRRCGLAWFVVVQAAVLVAWVFFRSESLDRARSASSAISSPASGRCRRRGCWRRLGSWRRWWRCTSGRGSTSTAAVPPLRRASRALLAAAMAYAIVTMYAGTSDFIYFQF